MSARRIGRYVVLLLAAAGTSLAQQVPFQLEAALDNTPVALQNGGQLSIQAAIGQVRTARITAIYTGTSQVTIRQQPSLSGSAAFSAHVTTPIPVTLGPGGTVAIDVLYAPTMAAQSTTQITLPFAETGGGSEGSIRLTLIGTVPSFTATYALQADQNAVALESGGTIQLPATVVDTTSQASLTLNNRGTGIGVVTGISISGTAFRLSGLPLFPVSVAASQSLQVQVVFHPSRVGPETGTIQVTFDTGLPLSIRLAGTGSSPAFEYQVLGTGAPVSVAPGGTITLADTDVGQSKSIVVQVRNSGNASGTINSISVAGQSFQLSNVPALPRTLAQDASLTFTVTFSPAQPGTQDGTLLINSDALNLKGLGLGSRLEFAYQTAAGAVRLTGTNNSVVFSPVMISKSSELAFSVRNTGTVAAILANIGVSQAAGPFMLTGLPALPASLDPASELHFTIRFAPVALGFANGVLQIDTTNVALVGSGTEPPPLPGYTIDGPSGNASPRTQASVGLTLASPYPIAIAGTLNLAVSGDLTADPAVQFSSGGRSVPFVIPANATSAIFGGQDTRIGLQTGTVAGTVTLTPVFATQAGAVDLTPASPPFLRFSVAPAPPSLTSIQITNRTADGFSIVVTGFTTTRTLTNWNVTFTAAAGYKIAASQFTIDVRQLASAWFQGSTSQSFGGQFVMTVPFTFQGTPASGQTLAGGIDGVAVTMSNDVGASSSIQAKLQ